MRSGKSAVPRPVVSLPRFAVLTLALGLMTAGFPATAARNSGRIKGTVRTPAGEPIPGVSVKLTVYAEDRTLLLVTHTDGQGIYRFNQLRPETYGLEVGGAGNEIERRESIVVRPPFRNIIDFTLGRVSHPPDPAAIPAEVPGDLRTVRGQLRNEEGKGIPDAWILLLGSSRAYRGRSDPGGSFLVNDVPSGSYRLEVHSPGYLSVMLPAVGVQAGMDLEIQLNLVDHPLDYPDALETLLPRETPLLPGP